MRKRTEDRRRRTGKRNVLHVMPAEGGRLVIHVFWNPETGHIVRPDGSIYAFEKYPDHPVECNTLKAAEEYMLSVERPANVEFQVHAGEENGDVI